MTTDLDRRLLLKAALVFAAAGTAEMGYAMDAAPVAPTRTHGRMPSPIKNVDVSTRRRTSSLFMATAQAAFFLFLRTLYIYPEQPFHRLIDEVSLTGRSDREIYRGRLPPTRRK